MNLSACAYDADLTLSGLLEDFEQILKCFFLGEKQTCVDDEDDEDDEEDDDE